MLKYFAYLTNCGIQEIFAEFTILLSLIIELNLVELVNPMLSYFQIFDGRVRSVISKFVVRQNGFDLRSIVEVVVALDGDEFGVLEQSCLKPNLKVLSIGPEASECIVLGRRVVITRTNLKFN